MRRALNVMQATFGAYHRVDFDGVYATTACPLPSDIDRIFHCLMNDEFTIAVTRASET